MEKLFCEDFVATDPQTQSVVVAHQGTDPENLLSIANDAEFAQVKLNSTLFPSTASMSSSLIICPSMSI